MNFAYRYYSFRAVALKYHWWLCPTQINGIRTFVIVVDPRQKGLLFFLPRGDPNVKLRLRTIQWRGSRLPSPVFD